MSLAPGEQRTLAEIESQLRRTDPELVGMFTRLAGAGGRGWSVMRRLPRREPGERSRVRTIILIAVGAALVIACIAMAVASAGRVVMPRPGSYLPGTGPAGGNSAVYGPRG